MNILLLSSIASSAIDALSERHDVVCGFDGGLDLEAALGDRDVVIFRSGVALSAVELDWAPKLELIIRAGSGFDNIDLDHCTRRGIRVARIPGPSAQAVAEFTFGLVLALGRRIVEADRKVRRGEWPKRTLGGSLLVGKTLGIVGAGNIGGRVGRLGSAWGMRVVGCVDPTLDVASPDIAVEGVTMQSFADVVANADILTVHCPLTPDTRGLIDADVMARMKPGALLVNTARGGIVDESALRSALASGHLAGAALDVHEAEGEGIVPELASFDNVVLTPHIGGMALESQEAIGARLVELLDAHEGGRFDDEVEPAERLA